MITFAASTETSAMDNYEEDKEYLRELLERFESVTGEGGYSFFDSGELEDIIYYYFSESEFAKALKAIDFAIEHFPSEVSFQVFKAQYFLNNGEPEKALARLNSLDAIDPQNPDILLTRATVFSSLHKHTEAIKEYQKALKRVNEDQDEILTSIAFEYQNLRDYRSAAEQLKRAITLNRENESLLYEIGYCYEMGQMSEEAIEFFTHEIDSRPYSYVAWYNLGIAYSTLELYEKAIDSFDYAIAIDPAFTPAFFSKAQCYEQMDMYLEAIAVYKLTFELEKPDSMTYYYIGDCYASLERYETAIEFYRKSISLERHFSDSWMGVGLCFVELGQHTEALSHMEQAVKIEPDNAEYFIVMAETQLLLGMNDEAAASYEKASELEPYHTDIWLDYSDFYADVKKDYVKALAILEDGIYYQGENSALTYRRVAYLYDSGKQKEAILELFIALTQDYDAHTQLLEYSENVRNSPEILAVIASYQNQK
jgi:tetratricopeptide (TPR) repeat protein